MYGECNLRVGRLYRKTCSTDLKIGQGTYLNALSFKIKINKINILGLLNIFKWPKHVVQRF